MTTHYDFTAIPNPDLPQAVDPAFRHALRGDASGANKAASVRRAGPVDGGIASPRL
jgi:hypothetical protein